MVIPNLKTDYLRLLCFCFPTDFDFGDEESWNETSLVEEADTTLTDTPGKLGNQAATKQAITKSRGRLKYLCILILPLS